MHLDYGFLLLSGLVFPLKDLWLQAKLQILFCRVGAYGAIQNETLIQMIGTKCQHRYQSHNDQTQ